MYFKRVEMTPEWAEALLKTNPRNRRVLAAESYKVTRDMINGNFEETHQAIAISPDGMLIDGHHRLMSVVESGKSVFMWAAFDAPNSSRIDSGRTRSINDRLYMSGKAEKGSIELNNLTGPLIRFAYTRTNGRSAAKRLTADDVHTLYMKHKRLIDTIVSMATSCEKGTRGSRKSSVLYSMMCAVASWVSEDTVKRWYMIVRTGDFYDEDSDLNTRAGRSVLLFRNYIQSVANHGDSPDDEWDAEIKKAMSSIRHFDAKKPVERLYGEYVYPKVVFALDDEQMKMEEA